MIFTPQNIIWYLITAFAVFATLRDFDETEARFRHVAMALVWPLYLVTLLLVWLLCED